MKLCKDNLLLYAVTDRHWAGKYSLLEQIELALKGGVTFLQLREKELNRDDFLKEAIQVKELCDKYKVPLIINDDVSIAAEMNADGVHVGQSDMKASEVRRIIGDDKILGVSVTTVKQAVSAETSGADYLGVGAVFPTGSKNDAERVSHAALKEICRAVSIPVVAIGGITSDNVTELACTGVCGVAVISAVFAPDDIQTATEKLKSSVIKMVSAKG
ncbi:MAG: thiamine phosphate synthase [Hornefia sp.]|nr:thiamine phosphate synthase [Hornefia sp.]